MSQPLCDNCGELRKRYLSGGGRFQVGDRVRYIGPPRVFHSGQEPVQPGAMATIVHDFGWDYRYLIALDQPVGRRFNECHDRVTFDIRPGNSLSDWEEA